MAVLAPDLVRDALVALDDDASLTVLAGGTDLMVDLNYGRRRPGDVLSLRRLGELRGWRVEPGEPDQVVLGAATTYTTLLSPALSTLLPALAQAARTVGSPQIRNTGTIGGNLATGSPAGDTLPVLVAHGASVELAAASGRRALPVADLLIGPKRTALRPGELITALRVPVAAGPGEFLKIGVRNAMVIAVANCALVLDPARRTVRCALGSVGPVPVRDPATEDWVGDRLDWNGGGALDATLATEFGQRMAAASHPIDDHRATADYRRRAVGVLAQRALERAWPASRGDDHRGRPVEAA
jgi:CO/xanthine dehydrogenase FAD-binding subunit